MAAAAAAAAVERPSGYRLCSVVCHHGGAVGGHYTCYRQHDRYQQQPEEEDEVSRSAVGKDEVEERKDEEKQLLTDERKDGGRLEADGSVDGSKRAVDRVWVHVSDDEVRRVSWREVSGCEAYIAVLREGNIVHTSSIDTTSISIAARAEEALQHSSRLSESSGRPSLQAETTKISWNTQTARCMSTSTTRLLLACPSPTSSLADDPNIPNHTSALYIQSPTHILQHACSHAQSTTSSSSA